MGRVWSFRALYDKHESKVWLWRLYLYLFAFLILHRLIAERIDAPCVAHLFSRGMEGRTSEVWA